MQCCCVLTEGEQRWSCEYKLCTQAGNLIFQLSTQTESRGKEGVWYQQQRTSSPADGDTVCVCVHPCCVQHCTTINLKLCDHRFEPASSCTLYRIWAPKPQILKWLKYITLIGLTIDIPHQLKAAHSLADQASESHWLINAVTFFDCWTRAVFVAM